MSSKINVLSIWKDQFSIFCKSFCGEVETICWESQKKCPKLFKSKFGYSKLLRKGFWSYFELKSECSERLKRPFFSFLQLFEWQSWNHFLGKSSKAVRQNVQNYLNENLAIGSVLKSGFKVNLSGKPNLLSVWKDHFWVFWKFLIDKNETIFCNSETKHSKLCK